MKSFEKNSSEHKFEEAHRKMREESEEIRDKAAKVGHENNPLIEELIQMLYENNPDGVLMRIEDGLPTLPNEIVSDIKNTALRYEERTR